MPGCTCSLSQEPDCLSVPAATCRCSSITMQTRLILCGACSDLPTLSSMLLLWA